MKKLYAYFVLSLFVFPLFSSLNKEQLDSLDNILSEKNNYFSQRLKRINILSRRISESSDATTTFNLTGEIFNELKSYNLDSAYRYVKQRLAVAVKSGDARWIQEAQMNLAEVYSITGMYNDALDILGNLNVAPDRLSYYYHIHHATYLQLKEFSFSTPEQEKYSRLAALYIDSLLQVIQKGTVDYDLVKSLKYRYDKKYQEALSITLPHMKNPNIDVHLKAMLAENISETYRALNDTENQEKYLIISAINDVKAGVKEFVSLRKLATVLYQKGDVERAYHYIKYSMEASTASNSRFRMMQTAQMLPIIVDSYELELRKKQNRLMYATVGVSVMLLLVLVSVFYIRRQKTRLQLAHNALDDLNHRLEDANESLNEINKSLTESAHVKEEYIGYVFNMCSAYIDKLEDFRKKVNRKLREDKSDELLKLTNNSTLIEDELKELLHSFDVVFLNIYPTFVEDFNKLLQPEKRIQPKQGELLSPEMRIYALVRLGIVDSTKIATFLHYSPQTVYNYRMKIRNNALYSREDFINAVQNIGYNKT